MNLQKRGDGAPEEPSSTPENNAPHSKKPVIVYIMVLFIVAFLLMALSFVMHQRSNTEALGELQSSVHAMQAMQATQEKVIALQDELAEANETIDKMEDESAETHAVLADTEREIEALLQLYTLQLQYSNHAYEDCKATILHMEQEKLVEVLPTDPVGTATAPAERFQQLKEAVLAK